MTPLTEYHSWISKTRKKTSDHFWRMEYRNHFYRLALETGDIKRCDLFCGKYSRKTQKYSYRIIYFVCYESSVYRQKPVVVFFFILMLMDHPKAFPLVLHHIPSVLFSWGNDHSVHHSKVKTRGRISVCIVSPMFILLSHHFYYDYYYFYTMTKFVR